MKNFKSKYKFLEIFKLCTPLSPNTLVDDIIYLLRCKCSRFCVCYQLYLLYVAEHLNTLVDEILTTSPLLHNNRNINITPLYIIETHNIHLSTPRWASTRQIPKTQRNHAKHVVHIFVYISRILEKQLKLSRRCT